MSEIFNKPLHLSAAILLIIVGALFYYGGEKEKQFEQSGPQYITSALTAISNWQAETLRAYLAPVAQRTFNEAQLQQLLERYRKLGRFESIKEIQFSRLASILSMGGEKIISYSGTAKFSSGDVPFTITLLPVAGGQFQIYNLHLGS